MKIFTIFTMLFCLLCTSQAFALGTPQSTNDIWVTILDPAGNPLKNASVTLENISVKSMRGGRDGDKDINKTVVTGTNGKAIFDIDPIYNTATIRLRITHEGYQYDSRETVTIPNTGHNEVNFKISTSTGIIIH